MTRSILGVLAVVLLMLSTKNVYAQETYYTTATLTTAGAGQAAIRFECSVSQNGGYENYYYAVDALCQLYAPDGSTLFDDGGGYQKDNSYAYQLIIPITEPGEYSAQSQYFLAMLPDDDDEGYFDDPYGILDVGVISEYGINQEVYVYGTGDDNEVPFDTFQFAEENGTINVGAPTISITPETYSLDRGQSQTFTASVTGVGEGGSTGVTWSISPSGVGTGSGSGNTYSYSAPATISSNQDITLKACSIYLPGVCATSTIALLLETVSVNLPNPSVVLADGATQVYWSANTENLPPNTSLTWTPSPTVGAPCTAGLICTTGVETGTLTAPAASSVAFGASPVTTVIGKACDNGANPAICGSNDLTLVQPVSISGNAASALAGTTTAITITGAGFGANPTVTVNNPNGGTFSNITFTPTNTPSNTQIQGNLFVPLNLVNVGASQPISLTVSATTDGITTSATSNPINIVSVTYTYSIALQVSNPSLTYGYSTLITPVMTCKIASSGATCPSAVFNPQTALASFSLTQNAAYASLSSTAGSNQSPPTFTIAQLSGYPSPSVIVQGCVAEPVAAPICATANISVPVTSISLTPSTVVNPLTGGKTQSFSASIQNEGVANALTWTLAASPSSAASGALASSTTSIAVQGTPASGTSGPNVYTAPASITTLTTVTLKACMSANTSVCSTPVIITLQPPPTFTVTATLASAQRALSMGHTMTYTVNVGALYGFNGTVALSVAGLPAGVTASLSTGTVNSAGTEVLTLSAAYSKSTYIGASTLTVTGTGGGLSVSTPVALTTRPLQYKGSCGVL